MKVSIAFMLVALSYCLSTSSSFYLPQMETMMSEEDIYFYTRMTDHLMCRYQEATECEEGPDRDFKMKCTLSDIFHIVGEMAEKLDCSMEEILCEMGVSDLTIEEMQDIISGEGSVDDLSSEECENFIISMLKGLIKMVLDLLRPFTGIVAGLLADGPLGGLLDAATGILDSVPLDMVTSILDSVPLDMVADIAGEALGAATGVVGGALEMTGSITGDSAVADIVGGALEVVGSVTGGSAVGDIVGGALEVVGSVTGESAVGDIVGGALEVVGSVTGGSAVGDIVGGALEVVGSVTGGSAVGDIVGEALAVPLGIVNSLGNGDALGQMGDTLTSLTEGEVLSGVSFDTVSVVTDNIILEGVTGQLNTEGLGYLGETSSVLEMPSVLTGSLDIAGEGGLQSVTDVEGFTNILSSAKLLPEHPVGGGLTGKMSGGGIFGLGTKGLTGGQQKAGKAGMNGLRPKRLLG